MAIKLKAKYKTEAEIPEGFKASYEEVDGEWVLTTVDIEDTSALKSAYERVKKSEKELRELAGKLPKDLSADEILALIEEKDKTEQDRAAKAGEWEKLKQQLVDGHKKELVKVSDRAAGLERAIHGLVRENAVMRAFDEMKEDIRSASLLRPHVESVIKVEEGPDFSFGVRVIDPKKGGEVRVADGSGTPFTPKQLIEEMRASDALAPAFNAPKSAGGGAEGDRSKRPGSGAVQKLSDLQTDTQKVAFIREHGREAYENLVIAAAHAPAPAIT